ncbi:hypothetical protein [Aeoliella sp. SH292]|uniref:hypothetical protein n=1 Tax=Aeoliella sp. SH292 TaxID=3454464 RepID=UPI003F9E466D
MHLETEAGTKFSSPSAGDIRHAIDTLDVDESTYAILTRSPQTYMQTMRLEDGFELEYQDGDTDHHYQADRLLTAEEVIAAMDSYAADDPQWKTMFVWQKLDLSATSPAKKGCAGAVLLVGGAATLAVLSWFA